MNKSLKDVELISSFNTVHGQRERRNASEVSSLLEDLSLERSIRAENLEARREILTENVINTISDTSRKLSSNNRRLQGVESYNESLTEELVEKVFTNIIFESLAVDSEFKEHNRSYIESQTTEFFRSIKEGIDYSSDTLFNDIVSKVNEAVKIDGQKSSNEELLENIIPTINFEFNLSTEILRNKVVEAVKIERNVVDSKTQMLTEGKTELVANRSTKTLFRTIHERNVEMVAKESAEGTPKDQLMNIAMAESLLDYTLLEAIHTLKMVELDLNNLVTNVRFL